MMTFSKVMIFQKETVLYRPIIKYISGMMFYVPESGERLVPTTPLQFSSRIDASEVSPPLLTFYT